MLRTARAFMPRRKSGYAFAAALLATFAGTAVSADTLAQPKDTSLEKAAANYVRFREDVAALEEMPFDSAHVTREAHRRLAAHEPADIAGGWVAYAALVAADTPDFAASLKKELEKKPNRRKNRLGGRDELISNLAADPSFARSLPGADEAIEAVLAMTAQDGARITALGEAFQEKAYAIQKTKWGKQRIASSQERIKEAASYSSKRGDAKPPKLDRNLDKGVLEPVLASAAKDWSVNWGSEAPTGKMSEANAKVIMDRILNLAARYSTDALNPKIVSVYAKNNKSQRCLEMSKLTLDQCIAATRTPYEEAFCLGKHGLNDIASCTGWVGSPSGS